MMTPPNLECARAMRDAGIDAMAALDTGLHAALAGLDAEQASEVKRAFGKAMGEIVCEVINAAVLAFPELEPDASDWTEAVRRRVRLRAEALGLALQPAP